MEKRLLGIILSVSGVIGLVLAGFNFINNDQGTKSIKVILLYGVLGAVFFFAGISLVRNTKNKAT